MQDEDFLRRLPAPQPYAEGAARLFIPDVALSGTRQLLQRAGQRESGLMWYGHRDENGDATVSLVVAPPQRMSARNYEVPANALTAFVRQLPDEMRPLAQVHSHPGWGVEHSRYDDEMIMSKRVLSLVFPVYGRDASSAFPHGVGVHEWQSNYWHLLSEDAAVRRVVIAPGTAEIRDLRR